MARIAGNAHQRTGWKLVGSIQKLHLRSRGAAQILEPSVEQKEKEVPRPSAFLPSLVNAWKRVEGFRRFRREACTRSSSFLDPQPRVLEYKKKKKKIYGTLDDFLEMKFLLPKADLATKEIVDEFRSTIRDPRSRHSRSLSLKASWSANQADHHLPWFFLPSGRWTRLEDDEESLLVTWSFRPSERASSCASRMYGGLEKCWHIPCFLATFLWKQMWNLSLEIVCYRTIANKCAIMAIPNDEVVR